jgi:hypothetical protein
LWRQQTLCGKKDIAQKYFLESFSKKGETFSISNILLQTIDIDQQRIAFSYLTIYLDLYATLRGVFPVSTSAHLPICPSAHLPLATFHLVPLPAHNTS